VGLTFSLTTKVFDLKYEDLPGKQMLM